VTSLLRKILDPKRWRRLGERSIENHRRRRLAAELDAAWAAVGPLPRRTGEGVILADGMWQNPNHFLRLRLFCAAATAVEGFRLAAVVRRRADVDAHRALERIGFTEFVYLEDDVEFKATDFLPNARRLLASVRDHRDVLALELPDEVPAYVLFDTVLKLSLHPRPPLDDPLWESTLAELLRNAAIYARTLAGYDVRHVALSHPWKSEWATLLWLALRRGVPSYHLTGFVDAIRIRRFRSLEDYATPVESLPFARFTALPPAVQHAVAEIGRSDLSRRASGGSSDINVRHAFRNDRRIGERDAARRALSGQVEKPVVIIYGHVWYDFPHTFAMRNFTDFLDWMEATIERCRQIDDVVWLLKPHPTEEWYGGFRLADVAINLPPHIRLLPLDTDSKTAMLAADCVVTVHGTVGLEAAAAGVSVLLADRSYYSDWNVATIARDRADYLRLLGMVRALPRPDADARIRAQACFALALATPPATTGALQITCDSRVSEAYREIIGRVSENPGLLKDEWRRIEAWLGQDSIDGFATYHLLATAQRNAAHTPSAANG
jgi:hypothetical protein